MIKALQDKRFLEHDKLSGHHDYEIVRKFYKGTTNKYYKLKCRLCDKELVTLSYETVEMINATGLMPVEDPPEYKTLTAKGYTTKYNKAQKGWY